MRLRKNTVCRGPTVATHWAQSREGYLGGCGMDVSSKAFLSAGS